MTKTTEALDFERWCLTPVVHGVGALSLLGWAAYCQAANDCPCGCRSCAAHCPKETTR